MALQQHELAYALAKQVPDMSRGFTINTNYGELVIAADDAAPIINAVRKLLERQLKAARSKD